MTDDEISELGTRGWFSREACPGAAEAAIAAQHRVDTSQLSPARISRRPQLNPLLRGDAIGWISAADEDFLPLTQMFEDLRCELNRDAWLGLARCEIQLAHYAGGGAAYARHLDAFRGAAGRRVTAIAYLNAKWVAADGGELRIHDCPVVDVAPLLGRLLVFMSATIEHEVLPTWAPRLAVTAWFYGP